MASFEHAEIAALLRETAGLRRLALALTHKPEAADDVVQHTLTAALEQRPSAAKPLGPWLARVARNWIAKSNRTHRRRTDIEARAAGHDALPSTQDLVIRAELHRELVAVVLALDERQRDVILLRYLEGLAPREIAAQLEVPLRTVNTRLARGLARLRSELDRRGGRERWLKAFMLLARTRSGPLSIGVLAMKFKVFSAVVVIALALLGLRVLTQRGATSTQTANVVDAPLVDAPHPIEHDVAESSRVAVPQPTPIGEVQEIDLERDLRVVVVTASGTPIPDASLVVVHPTARQLPGLLEFGAQADELVAQARSDANGRCTFHLEPKRLYDLTASAPGFARVASRSLYAGEDLRIVLPRGAVLHGSVVAVADGTPIARARVVVQLGVIASLADDGFETRSDANGIFELTELPVDLARVIVFAEGFPWFDEQVGVLHEGERRELRLALPTGTTVRGQVTDGSTKLPIAGATVELGRSRDVNLATTHADGRYTLHGANPGESTPLTARAPGYGDFQINAPGVAQGDIVQDFVLLPGRHAKGRVLDTHGTPIANANVAARASAYLQYAHQFETRRARTDAEGRFDFTGLRVDLRHTLLVHAAGLATSVRDFPEREWETLELDLGDIVLAPPAAIAGHVRDLAGSAVAGRWVLLDGEPRDRDAWSPSTVSDVGYADGEGFGFGRILARTDERGRYYFGELPGGTYRLWAGDKGVARGAELKLEVQDGEQLLDVDLELNLEPSIRGVVLDPSGRPLGDVAVDAFTTDSARTRVTYALTATDGSFALCGLEPGNYDLRCWPFFNTSDKSMHTARITVSGVAAGTHDLRIAMPRALETTVRVLSPDGKPVHGASVLLPDELGVGSEILGMTNPDGSFVLWLQESTTTRLRFAPPYGSALAGYVPVFDANGKLDLSYEVEVPDLHAGSSDCVVRFARLPE
jgi:RNA polymerase sigma-70 factor (ECF subfamily)